MKNILIYIIRFYQHLPLFVRGSCRFYPTCSEYCCQAIDAHGTIGGSWMCFKRVLKCNPLFAGGHNPVAKAEK